jgi:hypothetical protein
MKIRFCKLINDIVSVDSIATEDVMSSECEAIGGMRISRGD